MSSAALAMTPHPPPDPLVGCATVGHSLDLTALQTPGPSSLPWCTRPRLHLREFHAGDIEALMAMHADSRLRAHLVDDYPLQQEAVSRFFVERMATLYREHEGLGIWHASAPHVECASESDDPHHPKAFAGWFSLMPMAERPGEVELGARLKPEFWGTGLAIEGAECLLDHAFDDLGLQQVLGICHPDNRSALAVLAALGFVSDGVARYDYTLAHYHHIGMNAWRLACNTPRRTRLRQALRASRT